MYTIYEFGDTLLSTNDLDPVYVALAGADLPEPKLSRLLLSKRVFLSPWRCGVVG
jgi:hypothetical protein